MMDWIDENLNYNTYLRFDWGKYEHSVKPFDRMKSENDQEKCLLLYPQNDRMAMMKILDDMAPCLLGEIDEEEDEALWGRKSN